jgi:hypothetical protein
MPRLIKLHTNGKQQMLESGSWRGIAVLNLELDERLEFSALYLSAEV